MGNGGSAQHASHCSAGPWRAVLHRFSLYSSLLGLYLCFRCVSGTKSYEPHCRQCKSSTWRRRRGGPDCRTGFVQAPLDRQPRTLSTVLVDGKRHDPTTSALLQTGSWPGPTASVGITGIRGPELSWSLGGFSRARSCKPAFAARSTQHCEARQAVFGEGGKKKGRERDGERQGGRRGRVKKTSVTKIPRKNKELARLETASRNELPPLLSETPTSEANQMGATQTSGPATRWLPRHSREKKTRAPHLQRKPLSTYDAQGPRRVAGKTGRAHVPVFSPSPNTTVS